MTGNLEVAQHVRLKTAGNRIAIGLVDLVSSDDCVTGRAKLSRLAQTNADILPVSIAGD